MDDELRTALTLIERSRGVDPAGLGVEHLGGLTNRNYRFEHAGERFVLRIAGDGTGEYVDRAVEAHDAREAAAAGVGAEVLHLDVADGLMRTLWGLIQHVNDNRAEDFRAYGSGRFDRCRALMASREFARHLESCAR